MTHMSRNKAFTGKLTSLALLSLVLFTGCAPLGGMSVEEGQEKFLIAVCPVAHGINDLQFAFVYGTPEMMAKAIDSIVEESESAATTFESTDWPSKIDRGDLSLLAQAHHEQADAYRGFNMEVLDAPIYRWDTATNLAYDRVAEALSVEDVFEVCGVEEVE